MGDNSVAGLRSQRGSNIPGFRRGTRKKSGPLHIVRSISNRLGQKAQLAKSVFPGPDSFILEFLPDGYVFQGTGIAGHFELDCI
jgi:hypothetical protein